MCGIVGYIGNRNAAPILIKALKKLEYRGYDSAGIAVYTGEEILVQKAKGKLKNLGEKITGQVIPENLKDDEFTKFEMSLYEKTGDIIKGNLGIGHTRWATHGEPSDLNSHPHTNMEGSISIVHNGIIENYADLKAKLQSEGIVFKSQTDTEVVVHLIDKYYKEEKDIFKAVLKVLHVIEGSYALGVICRDYPDRIICCRTESPLVIGLGKGENFIASDIPAILEYTRNTYLLNDLEIVHLTRNKVEICDLDKNPVIKNIFKVEWDIASAEKCGYEHFMLKEMNEQPKVIHDTIMPRIKDGMIEFDTIHITAEELKNISRIFIVACGSAYHAGMVGKYLIENFARIPVEVDIASEFRYKNPIIDDKTLVIIISQSGETADTLAALRDAKSKSAKILGIVNVVGSSIAREADDVIYTWAGPEIAVASTKGYTTQLSAMYMLAIKFGVLSGNLKLDEAKKLVEELLTIPEKMDVLLGKMDVVESMAELHHLESDIFYLGRGLDYMVAMEGSLKLKEISYIHSEAYAAGELKHGTISLIEDGTLVIGVLTQGDLYEKNDC